VREPMVCQAHDDVDMFDVQRADMPGSGLHFDVRPDRRQPSCAGDLFLSGHRSVRCLRRASDRAGSKAACSRSRPKRFLGLPVPMHPDQCLGCKPDKSCYEQYGSQRGH